MKRLIRWTIYIIVLYVLWKKSASFKEFISTPIQFAKGVSTAIELRQIQSAMEQYKVMNGEYPKDFRAFMLKAFISPGKSVLADSWGMQYRCDDYSWGHLIYSAGYDRIYHTKDDFYLKVMEQ